jgi:hypothetical protein
MTEMWIAGEKDGYDGLLKLEAIISYLLSLVDVGIALSQFF